MRLAAALGDEFDFAAATVDHGLRPEAAGEAAQAAAWCAAANIPHTTLCWRPDGAPAGLQAAARRARYRLLAGHAVQNGFGAILTGHTADDQAETVFMRLARGSGLRGLAAMAPRRAIATGALDPVSLLRPLLAVPREAVQAYLAEIAQPFIDDPSNFDTDFERVRTRALLAALAEQDLLTRAALVRTASRMRVAADQIEAMENDAFRAAGGRFDANGAALFPGDAPSPGLAARLIRAVGGADHVRDEADVAAVLAAQKGTLGGAIIERTSSGWRFTREPAALTGRAGVAPMAPVTLASGERALWDDRFVIENTGATQLVIGPRGDSADGALAATPAVIGDHETGGANDPALRVTSLAEERFFGAIMRFS